MWKADVGVEECSRKEGVANVAQCEVQSQEEQEGRQGGPFSLVSGKRMEATLLRGRDRRSGTGIVDAIIARIRPDDADAVELKLVQLKSGAGGLTAREITRLKEAVTKLSKDWLLAAFDGNTLHILPEMLHRRSANAGAAEAR